MRWEVPVEVDVLGVLPLHWAIRVTGPHLMVATGIRVPDDGHVASVDGVLEKSRYDTYSDVCSGGLSGVVSGHDYGGAVRGVRIFSVEEDRSDFVLGVVVENVVALP